MANGFGRAVNSLLAIALTPLFLHELGAEQYGIWLLAATLTFAGGFLSLAELGLQPAAVRFVAEAHSRNDRDDINGVVCTTTAIYALLGVALGLLLAALAPVFVSVFSVTPDLERTARLLFVVVGAQIALDLPAAGIATALEGMQRYGALRAVDLGLRVAWAAVSAYLVTQGHGVLVLAWTALATSALTLVAYVLLTKRLHPAARFGSHHVRRATFRRLTKAGVPTMGLRVLGVMYSQMDRIVIGVMLAASFVAAYEVAYKVHAMAALTLGVLPSAVLPAAAYLNAAGDRSRLRSLYVRGTTYALALGLPIVVGAIIYARAIIATWVGNEYTGITGAARLFLIYPALALALVIGQTMLIGLGRMKEMLRYHLVAVLTNLGLSIILVPRIGMIGVIWGTTVGYLLLWVPFTRLLLAEFGESFRGWVRKVLVPVLPGLAVQAAFGLLTVRYVEGLGQLWQVGVMFTLSYALALGAFLALSPARERTALAQALRLRRPPATEPASDEGRALQDPVADAVEGSAGAGRQVGQVVGGEAGQAR